MKINFEDCLYYPALRSRAAELAGLKQLDNEVKQKVLPIITLGKWPRSEDIQSSLDKSIDAMGDAPFILDLTREATHHNGSSLALQSDSDGFKAWRNFVSQHEQIIPVVQITKSTRLRDLVKQAKELERSRISLAFRISDFESDTDRVISAMASLDRPENALVIVDMGYIRNAVPMATSAAIRTINNVRDEIPEASICLISTSFPQSVTSFAMNARGTNGTIDILERELYENIGGRGVALYGDHSSIHSVVYPDSGGRYVPRIDLPLDDAWYFERRPDTTSEGYIDAAQAILETHPWIAEQSEWGAQMIRNAAQGNIEGMGSPAKWIAVRVNMHITRQLALANTLSQAEDEDEEFDADF